MKVRIKDIVEYYKKFPEHKGKIEVLTRYGHFPILEAAKTATKDTVYEVKTNDGKVLKCSGNHLLLKNGEWCKVKNLNNGDIIHTEAGEQPLKYVRRTNKKKDLFDLQVHQVEEYYTNGITSHNSALIEGYYYALFGTTIRALKKEQVINNVTKGAGKIELIFSVETENSLERYKISRKLKPSSVELWRLGDTDENISKDSIVNTNKYICDLIGSNPSISKSCDIISLTDSVSFMSMKPEEKRKFNEDIFTLEVFGKMSKELKDLIKANKSELAISTAKVSEISNTLRVLTDQYETQKKNAEHRFEIYENRKRELENQISELQKEHDNIPESTEEQIVKDQNKYKKAIEKLDGELAAILTQKSILLAEKNQKIVDQEKKSELQESVCDRCFQVIPHTHIEVIERRVTELQEEIISLAERINEFEDKKVTALAKKGKIQDKLSKLTQDLKVQMVNDHKKTEICSQMANIRLLLTNMGDDMALNEDSFESFLVSIAETEKRLENENTSLKSLQDLADVYETCKFIIGDDGVKSSIVKRLLNMLNTAIQVYITKLGMTMKCKFDEYFEERITNDKGDLISYWNLSGGERRTVDIACAWAFKDIKRKVSGVRSNVEFLDEILDSALDEVGLDKLIETLKERIDNQGLSCYAISHRKETEKHIDGEVVYLVKEKRITKRVDRT